MSEIKINNTIPLVAVIMASVALGGWFVSARASEERIEKIDEKVYRLENAVIKQQIIDNNQDNRLKGIEAGIERLEAKFDEILKVMTVTSPRSN